MRKEHAMAIFIGLLMVLSVAGFAISGIRFNPASKPADVPTIVNQLLSKEQFRSILLSGKTIIQYHYPMNCSACSETGQALEEFANSKAESLVLEEFSIQSNETLKFQMVSPTGEIKDLSGEALINQTVLLDSFCKISYVQTKECLLREI